jgi:hypothetical protein
MSQIQLHGDWLMATFTKRITSAGKIRWYVRIRRPGQPTVCKSFTLKTDAHTWASHAEAKQDRGQALPDQESCKRTLAQLIEGVQRQRAENRHTERLPNPASVVG